MNEKLRKLMGRIYRDEAGDGTGTSADGGDGGAEASTETSLLDDMSDEAGKADDAPEQDATLTPEQRADKAAEKDTRRPKHIPAKFWNAEKGEANLEAWSKSYGELEGRIRDVGIPPKSAEEYKYDVPKTFKEAGVDFDPDELKNIREFAIKAGLTQKQFEATMNGLYGNAEQIVRLGERLERAETMKALTDHYKTREAVQANVQAAYNVFQAYADDDEMQHMYRIVNDPVAVRVLAKINKELQEDPGIQSGNVLKGEDIDELMAPGGPYWDANHPQHARVKAKVTAHFESKAKAEGRKRAA